MIVAPSASEEARRPCPRSNPHRAARDVACNVYSWQNVTCNEVTGAPLGASFMSERTRVSERVQKHRVALRAAGLRPVQIWVPDTRRPGFAAECRRQSLSLQGDPFEDKTLQWLDEVADADGWK